MAKYQIVKDKWESCMGKGLIDRWVGKRSDGEFIVVSLTSAEDCEKRLRDAVAASTPVLVKEIEL